MRKDAVKENLVLGKAYGGPALLSKQQEVKAEASADSNGPKASASYTCRC